MPKEFDDCVSGVMAGGKSKDAAYAICVSQYTKKHGVSPFKKEEIQELPISEKSKIIIEKAIEAVEQGKTMKVIEDITGIVIDSSDVKIQE